MRRRRKKRRKGLGINVYLYAIVILILITSLYGFITVEKKIKPTVLAIAEIKAKEIASKAINESIKSKITDEIRYQDLYFIRTDNDGSITYMQANTIMMNKLAADVALEVQKQIKDIEINDRTRIKIPLGNILGSQLLGQYGPKIDIKITPVGRVSVNFFTEFQNSGINQTRHKIYLNVNTQVKTIIPFVSKAVSVDSTVPIAETIIVGKVPDNYINVPKEDILNVAPDDKK